MAWLYLCHSIQLSLRHLLIYLSVSIIYHNINVIIELACIDVDDR
jgi:hypothetical protein